jgi:hypothetical protein
MAKVGEDPGKPKAVKMENAPTPHTDPAIIKKVKKFTVGFSLKGELQLLLFDVFCSKLHRHFAQPA